MRFPSFKSIENFYVQSLHGLNGIPIGEHVDTSMIDPVRLRRLYITKRIGSKEQVERFLKKYGLENLAIEKNFDGIDKQKISNASMGLKKPDLKKGNK